MPIREAAAEDDPLLVRHYLALWESYGTPAEHLFPDAAERVLAFLADGRKRRKLAAFIAEEGGEAVGSAACQLHLSPFPEVVAPEHRLFGYVFSVFVEPAFRRRGIAEALTRRAIEHLRAAGCTHVALHSSEAGLRLYESLGFEPAHEMRLKLR